MGRVTRPGPAAGAVERLGDALQAMQDRPQELEQPGERDIGLGLDPARRTAALEMLSRNTNPKLTQPVKSLRGKITYA
jgi:hypothetical protein